MAQTNEKNKKSSVSGEDEEHEVSERRYHYAYQASGSIELIK